jgi:hypothetical protein
MLADDSGRLTGYAEVIPVPSKVQVVTSQRSDRTHAAAKQPVPMATPMAGTRNQ